MKQRVTQEWKFSCFVLQMLYFHHMATILHHNIFFGGSHYLQVQGVATGTCFAPSYANLYLGEWEKHFLTDEQLSMYTCHIVVWKRYIEIHFLIWDGPEDKLKYCLKQIIHNNSNVFFTMAYDAHQVDILDISIVKDQEWGLTSRLFWKETAGNSLLHIGSFHPEPLQKSIPYS